MAKRPAISFKNISPRIIGALETYRAARIQRFEVRGTFPTTDVEEHGNSSQVGMTYEIPDYTVTLAALDVSIKLFAALTGTDSTAYPGGGVSVNALDTVDIAGDVKHKSTSDYVKVLYMRKCRPTTLRFSYSVEGQSTEEYTFAASIRYLFTHDVYVDVFTGTPSSPQTLTEKAEVLRSGDYAISVMADGEYLTEVSGVAASTDEYLLDSGTKEISYGDTPVTLVVAYKAAPSGTNWSDVSDATIPTAISGKNVPVYIEAEDASSNISILRVQSVNINVDLRADPIREQGNNEIVDYITQIPQVTGDITVLDTDDELIELLSAGVITSSYTEFRTCDLLADRDLNLKIRLRDPSDPCSSSGAVLKTVYVPNIQLTGESYTSNVGDNMTYTMNWKSAEGNLVIYSGSY